MSVCPSCGTTFRCDLNSGQTRCWCFDLPHVVELGSTTDGCLCPDCLAQRISARQATQIDRNSPDESLQLPTGADQNARFNTESPAGSRNNRLEQH